MILKFVVVTAFGALWFQATGLTQHCSVQNTSPVGQWKFFRIHDANTDEILMAQAINGGDTKEVRFPGKLVRVDSKLPGETIYKRGVVGLCKGGNVLRT